MKMHHFGLFAAMVLMIAVTGPPAMAQTPDGSTPAVEGICDTLKADGISKGLYGLCVAYCEAQDYASEDLPLTEADILALLEAGAPSGRILENYNKRRTVDDPEMPCVVRKVESCPCFTQEEATRIDGYRDGDGVPYTTAWCSTTDPLLVPGDGVAEEGNIRRKIGSGALAFTRWTADSGRCVYRARGESVVYSESRTIDPITREEALACREVLLASPLCTTP